MVLLDWNFDWVMVVMSIGGVYVSDDGGEKWMLSNSGIGVLFLSDLLLEFG